MRCNRRAGSSGVGLVEVLVAMLLLGIGLSGVLAMQARAARDGHAALLSANATIQLQSMMERLRADRDAALSGRHSVSMRCSAGSGFTGEWIQHLQQVLGGQQRSCGQVSCDGSACKVRIRWQQRREAGADAAKSAGPVQRERELQARL